MADLPALKQALQAGSQCRTLQATVLAADTCADLLEALAELETRRRRAALVVHIAPTQPAGYRAELVGREGCWGTGPDPAGAAGDLLLSWALVFGVEVRSL